MNAQDQSPELTRIGRAFAVPEFHPWEALCIRILFAVVILQTLPLDPMDSGPFKWGSVLAPAKRIVYDAQPLPNGLAHWVDFTFISNPDLQKPLWIVSLVCLASYVAGRGLVLSLPILACIGIAARTLENSQGAISHKYQIVSLILLVQAVIVVAGASRRIFAGKPAPPPGRRPIDRLNDRLIRYSQIAIVAVYVISGCTKLIASEGEWIANSPYIGLYLVKTDRQNYYNKLDAENFGGEVPVAEQMLAHRNLSRIFMGAGLFLELFAFLALYNRFTALGIGVALVIFHQLVIQFMALTFPLNEKVLWIFLINVPFWIGAVVMLVKAKLISSPGQSAG